MRVWVIAASVLLVSPAASAQQSSKDILASFGIKIVEPMTAKELTAAKARVDAELEKSGTAALFENVSDANGGKARHRASGLVCPLGKKGQRVLAASMAEASCETKDGSTIYQTRVEKAPEGATLETAVAVTGHPRPGSGRPDHQTLRFLSQISGQERLSRLQIGVVRGWVLTERRITSNKNAKPSTMADVLSEATFGTGMDIQQ